MQNSSENIDSENLLQRLKSKVNDIFSQSDFDLDLKTLSTEYEKVIPELKVQEDSLNIVLKIFPRPFIRKIHWKGAEKISVKRLEKELSVPLNSDYMQNSFNKALQKLQSYYVKKGFFEAQIEYDVMRASSENSVEITIKIDEGRSGRIKKILFKGLEKNEEDEILKQMISKPYNAFLSWVSGTGSLVDENIEQDRLIIINYLQNLGFADAQVSIKALETKKDHRINLMINVEKGPAYTFDEITVSGYKLFDKEKIQQQVLCKKGEAFSPEKIRQSVKNITDLYGSQGYIESYVTHEQQLVREKKAYSLHFSVQEGERYRVGLIKIFGNQSTKSRVILNESLLVPGEIFDIRKLRATEEKLLMIDYFKNVNVYWSKSSENLSHKETFRDIHIEVEEKSTGQFGCSFGISTRESVFGGLDLQERNFNIRGMKNIFKEGLPALRGDGEYAHARLDVGKKARNMLLSWQKPHFMDTPWLFGFNIEQSNNRQHSDDYHINSLGFNLHASYPLSSYWRFEWQYRLRDIDIFVKEKKLSQDSSASSSTQNTALREQMSKGGIVSASGISFVFDSLDNPFKPKNGFSSRIEAEYAGLGGDYDFLSLSYLNSYYTQLHKTGVFKYRFDFRFINPLSSTLQENLPLAERLFLGGEDSVRGYRSFSLGPKYNNRSPKGGISSTLISLEYQRNINETFDAFAFFDAGNVNLERFHFGIMNISYGYGLRIGVFNKVPLTMGVGHPVNSENRDQEKRFFFSIGTRF